jgi:hypothetical protein
MLLLKYALVEERSRSFLPGLNATPPVIKSDVANFMGVEEAAMGEEVML